VGVYAILVRFPDDPKPVTFYRTIEDVKIMNGQSFRKQAFSLQLAYAYTVHKSQGMTIKCPTIIHIQKAFCRGMWYVALSRVSEKKLVSLVGMPDASGFLPIEEQFRG
jgi:ATP-dependent exoDNAse (exonuclease V) alpha subunit